MSFRSGLSLAKAAKAYATRLRKAGWETSLPADVTKSTALLGFTEGDSTITVIMRRGDSGSTDVQVVASG